MSKYEQVLDGWANALAAIDAAEDALIGLLDFDPDNTCEAFSRSTGDVCGAPAAWWAVYRCCRTHVAICEAHKALFEAKGGRARCVRCDIIHPHFGLALEFVPIGGKS